MNSSQGGSVKKSNPVDHVKESNSTSDGPKDPTLGLSNLSLHETQIRSVEELGASYPVKWTLNGDVVVDNGFTLTNDIEGTASIIFDYGLAIGGIPFISTSSITTTNGEQVIIEAIYSENLAGVSNPLGDGPFFLYSNAMNSYRHETYIFNSSTPQSRVVQYFTQRSQRYQKIILKTPCSSVTISSVGFTHIRPPRPCKSIFKCSNEKLNAIWEDGTRSVDMCTVEAGEISEAWEVTTEGTRIRGQHWSPYRYGTRWADKTVEFEVKIESGGASWSVHAVALGLVFVLDIETQSLSAFEGFSNWGGIFPPKPQGNWLLDAKIKAEEWVKVKTVAKGTNVWIDINNDTIAVIPDLQFQPLRRDSPKNTGSVAFGGPENYTGVYRSLRIEDGNGVTLYENELLLKNKARTLNDFAVGTNPLACTIDGAKRDCALFAGDLFVMGRSIYYSTSNLEAVLGSIRLLTSHQRQDGFLGNLSPIQAPMTEEHIEPPADTSYSLSYALLLVVTVKDYWLYSGDTDLVKSIWRKLDAFINFTAKFLDSRGLVVAPPPMLMDWFPRGGPIFGASGKVNLAYYDALKSMSLMSSSIGEPDTYTSRADELRASIVAHLWNSEAGLMKMSDKVSPTGFSQDIHAYAISTGVCPSNPKRTLALISSEEERLPLPFRNLPGWDDKDIISPYSSGFAAEALFEEGEGFAAVRLIEDLWGIMSDKLNTDYSGGHWEAMNQNGAPQSDHTSLHHGWSTWPVFLLPKYLGGIEPLEPGWRRCKVKPILAGLEFVNVQVVIPAGLAKVELRMEESQGQITITVPSETVVELWAPTGWAFVDINREKKVIEGGGGYPVQIRKLLYSK